MRRLKKFLIVISLILTSCISQSPAANTPQLPAGPVAVTITTVEILRVAADNPDVQVKVTGSLPDGCSQLKDPSLEREGRLYSISLDGVRVVIDACEPGPIAFTKTVPLPLGFDSSPTVGRFGVLVNGIIQYFEVLSASTQAPPVAEVAAQATVVAPASITRTPDPAVTTGPAATATEVVSNPLPVTAATPLPENLTLGTAVGPENCTNVAAFFEDVTIPSGTSVDPGTSFVKTWKVRNEGTCTWGQGYQLVFVNGNILGASLSTPLPQAAPDEIIEISVPMTAPKLPGLYHGDWGFLTSDGQAFGVGSAGQIPLKVKLGVRQLPTQDTGCEYQFSAEEEQKILEFINEERAKNGLPPHVVDDALSDVAREHSLERGCLGVHSHFGADGKNYETRVQRADIGYRFINEIIYNGAAGAKWAVHWWVYKSKLHHDIVMSEKYSMVGIGYVRTNRGEYPDYFTVVLIAPPTP